MTESKWVFDINNKKHEIILKFGFLSGRQILLDGNLVNSGRNPFERGSEFQISVDDKKVDLGIVSTAIGYEYYLCIDNEIVFPVDAKSNKISKAISKIFEERRKWEELGVEYGIEYYPLSNAPLAFRHRLIGYFQGFLVVIGIGSRKVGEYTTPGLYIQIRHALLDDEKTKEIKGSENIKRILKEMRIPADWLEIRTEFSSLFIALGAKKKSEIELVEELFSFFYIFSPYLKPVFSRKCEGVECRSPLYQDLTLTLINGVPFSMCDECIGRIDEIARKAEEEYRNRPPNLLKGILYGVVATFLGAIIWALIFIFLDSIGAVFAVFTFFIVVKAMDYAQTKRTFISLVIASVLSFVGSIAGTYIGVVGYLLKEGQIELTLSELFELAKFLFEEPELLNQTIMFSLIGLVPYFFITWNENRKNLKSFFKPDVELVKGFELN